jgi:hypothetical protein
MHDKPVSPGAFGIEERLVGTCEKTILAAGMIRKDSAADRDRQGEIGGLPD